MKVPRKFQVAAIQLGLEKNALIADACGLGKTLDGIEIGKEYRGRCSARWRYLIVCPLRVRPQWVQELQDQDPGTPIRVLDPGLPFKLQYKGFPQGWYIIYYEGIVRMESALRDWHWDLVICDEAHRLKNKDTQWTKAIKKIPATRKIALTGTPQERGPHDIWSLGNWLYPDVFTSYWKFRDHYVDINEYTGKVEGVKNEQQLASVLGQFVIRRTKEDVASDLPPRIIQTVDVEMTELQARDYKAILNADDIVVDVEDQKMVIPNVLSTIVRCQQVSSYPGLLGLKARSGKLEWVMEWLDDHKDQSVVIFSKFRGTVDYLLNAIGSARADIITGGVRDLPSAFLEGRKNILLGTIAAMGEGLNLQRADVAIFIDQEWSTVKMNQAFDRIHRMNVDKAKLLYMLRSTPTDELVLKALDKKWTDMELVYAAIELWKKERTG